MKALYTYCISVCSHDIDGAASDLKVLELVQGHLSIRPGAENKHHPTDVAIWARRPRRPQKGDRVGLGESGPDGRLDLGRRGTE
jgi:hypothetical protein